MKRKISYLLMGGTLLIILLFTIFRSSTHNRFRPDAKKHAIASLNKANLIDSASLNKLKNPLLIEFKSNSGSIIQSYGFKVLQVVPEKLLEAGNVKTIRTYKGTKVLVSNDPAISSRAWMILSQMGIQDLYILAQ